MKNIFTSNYEQQDTFVNTAYAMGRRSFKELWSLEGMNKQLVKSDAIIMGQLASFSEIDFYEFQKKFIFLSFEKYKCRLEDMLENNSALFEQFIDYVEKWEPRQKDKLRFEKITYELFKMKGEFYQKQKLYLQATKNFQKSN